MKYKIDYLLRYVTQDTFEKIVSNNNDYILELLQDNYIDVDLNIKFLIKYGITNIEKVIVNMLSELLTDHNKFIEKIKSYEKNLTREEVITLIENMY